LTGQPIEGSLRHRIGESDIPRAFIGLLNGQDFGKQLVKLI